MVALQKADTNLDEVVNDVNNLVNCTHCHGPFFLLFFFFFFFFLFFCFVYVCGCVWVPFFFFLFFFFVLYLRYMNERGGGEEREKEIVMDGYMLMNKKIKKVNIDNKTSSLTPKSPSTTTQHHRQHKSQCQQQQQQQQ